MLVWRITCGDPQHALQVESVGHVPGHCDVPHVRRVERAPEEADAPPSRAAQVLPSVLSSAASMESGYSSRSRSRASTARSE